ncbi:hypothetical protein RIF29_17424 [Crotalaria pallida]|uniref:Uncharacterized protein n=1 Tax=Crotalaria pallida TaxID=3830 RepID=A0AAN9FKH9_CROPI
MLWLEGVSESVAERRRIVHHGGSGDEDMIDALLGRFTMAINREHDNGVGHGGLRERGERGLRHKRALFVLILQLCMRGFCS